MKKLTAAVCLKVWNELPKPSLRTVKIETGRRGYINPLTNNPYSRQWIRVLLSTTPEGRMKLGRPADSAPIRAERVKPVIVEDNQNMLAWYREHGFVGYTIISPDKVRVEDVRLRYVYGNLPLSIARHARSVWLPESKDGELCLTEYKVKKIA